MGIRTPTKDELETLPLPIEDVIELVCRWDCRIVDRIKIENPKQTQLFDNPKERIFLRVERIREPQDKMHRQEWIEALPENFYFKTQSENKTIIERIIAWLRRK